MTKLLSIFTIFLISCGTPSNLSINQPLVNTVLKTETSAKFPTDSFVMIRKVLSINKCKNKECQTGKFRALGSGISIGRYQNGSLILTAGHVCDSGISTEQSENIEDYSLSIEIVTTEALIVPSVVIHKVFDNDTGNDIDLCMLYAENIIIDGVILASKAPKIGEKVYAISAPAGIFHPPTVPILSGHYSGPIPDTGNAMVTIPAIGGSSGSGIFDKDMRLVGILFATHPFFNIITLTSSWSTTLIFVNDSFRILLDGTRN